MSRLPMLAPAVPLRSFGPAGPDCSAEALPQDLEAEYVFLLQGEGVSQWEQ